MQKCIHCGAAIEEGQNYCPNCGMKIQDNPESGEGQTFRIPPQTIEELRQFCAVNEMPLERMRFFIGVDCKEAKAFGIYSEGERFVVYKNKADGSRAVRYQGPDEQYAVHELYAKLLDECHARGIYPDGIPQEQAGQQRNSFSIIVITALILLAVCAVIFFWVVSEAHEQDGYYAYENNVYYMYDDDWFYYDLMYLDWVAADGFPYDDYDDYYLGDSYNSDWNVMDFRNSEVYSEIRGRESSSGYTSSSDYDSWDSSDTNWDSDW